MFIVRKSRVGWKQISFKERNALRPYQDQLLLKCIVNQLNVCTGMECD